MTTQPAEYVRPEWRDVNIDKLAQRLRTAYVTRKPNVDVWSVVAEAAVEMIVDEPEREFQAQIDKVLSGEPNEILTLNSPVTESQAAREWREASASDWIE